MSSILPSHIENCTLRNALSGGMYRSHFYQFRVQSQLFSRIAHLVLGILEAIPIIGQFFSLIELQITRIGHLVLGIFEAIPIIGQFFSLIELQIIRCRSSNPSSLAPEPSSSIGAGSSSSYPPIPMPSTPIFIRPEPKSCIPQIPKVAFQENPTDIRRIWPINLQQLGLTEAQKTEVDSHVRDSVRAIRNGGNLSYGKKRLTYTDGAHTVDAILPITLCIFKEDGNIRVLLFSKTVFASGGERKIRWAYDLTTGTFLLKKRIVGLFEEKILNYLISLRIGRGIQTSISWRNSSDKLNQTKRQMIESVRDGTLSTLFGTAPLSNFSVKRDLIIDLLTDLNDLHDGTLKVSITSKNFRGETLSQDLSYSTFHSDIKPLNVLVFFRDGRWRAELCDFGVSAHPTAFVISIGYTPPEYIRFYQEKRPLGIENKRLNENTFDIASFIAQHGRGRDVWAMGLVVLCLLMEREEEVFCENVFQKKLFTTLVAPLPCLKALLSGKLWNRYDEQNILNLKQETLNADIDLLQQEAFLKHPEEQTELAKIFEMLKEMMLRINPNERKTTADCLAFLQHESQDIA